MTQAIKSFAEQPAARSTHASDVVAPLGDAWWAKTQLSVMNWITSKIGYSDRLDEAQFGKRVSVFRGPVHRLAPPSPKLTLDEAQRQVVAAGLTLDDVNVSEGDRAEPVKIKIDRALETKRLEGIVARADQGLGTQLLLGATGLAVDFADPVNLATMAIPGVGEVKAAALLAKATARLGPTISKYAVRAGVGAYEGAVSSAMLEPVDYVIDQRLGNDHSLADSAWNIGLGALGGSVLRVGGGAGVDLYHSIRMREAFSVDDCCAAMDNTLWQFSQGHPVEFPSAVPEQGARVLPDGRVAKADAAFRGDMSRYLSNGILVTPSAEVGGERVTLTDLISLKDTLREYHPVESAELTAGKIYRVKNGDEVVVYTKSADDDTFTVQRFDASHPDHGSPLSARKDDAEIGSWEDDKRLLFVRPPVELSKAFAEVVNNHIAKIGKKTSQELMRYFPPGLRGHTVDAEIGQVADKFFRKHALTARDLHPGWKQTIGPDKRELVPDAFHALREDPASGNYVELKPHTKEGWQQGHEQANRYQEHLRRETVVLTYTVPQASVGALKDAVRKAWDIHLPGLRAKWKGMTADERKAAYALVKPPKEEQPTKEKKATKAQKPRKEQKPPKERPPAESKRSRERKVRAPRNIAPGVAGPADSE